jgi:mannose-1-phosphate guanylyltransferase/mannose-1-phosphate guanylyltransferase/mannose-6-phosphate isomerase
MIVPVILSGGEGRRLWPLSSSDRPKQVLSLTGDETLLANRTWVWSGSIL